MSANFLADCTKLSDGIADAARQTGYAQGYAACLAESAAKIAELEKACAAVDADARRYRFLRDAEYDHAAIHELLIAANNHRDYVDVSIDAALSASRAGGQTEGK